MRRALKYEKKSDIRTLATLSSRGRSENSVVGPVMGFSTRDQVYNGRRHTGFLSANDPAGHYMPTGVFFGHCSHNPLRDPISRYKNDTNFHSL
jgi:hypothetical protein